MNGGDMFAVGLLLMFGALGLYVYLMPILIAADRHSENTTVVALVTLLLGWTVIGWLIALLMAYGDGNTATCPECAEKIKKGARVCRHCGARIGAISAAFALLTCMQSSIVLAGGLYKHVDENGNITYSDKPSPGAKKLKIESRRTEPRVYSDSAVRRWNGQPSAGDSKTVIINRKVIVNTEPLAKEFRRRSRQIDAELRSIDEKLCQSARDSLRRAEKRWREKQRSGYRPWEQEHYEGRIEYARDRVSRECE